jgi:hypothetical protein
VAWQTAGPVNPNLDRAVLRWARHPEIDQLESEVGHEAVDTTQ